MVHLASSETVEEKYGWSSDCRERKSTQLHPQRSHPHTHTTHHKWVRNTGCQRMVRLCVCEDHIHQLMQGPHQQRVKSSWYLCIGVEVLGEELFDFSSDEVIPPRV